MTTEPTEAQQLEVAEQQAQAMQLLAARKEYLLDDKVRDFGQFPLVQKLAVCQTIEKFFVKSRKVGPVMVPYLPHQTAEKILNFVFNFRVSNEVLEVHSDDSTQQTSYKDNETGEWKKKDSKAFDAWALVKFTFTTDNGDIITRTVVGTHKGFENPATSKHEAKKAAISKSWTVVARTFGIGTDLEKKEEAAWDRASKNQPQTKQEKAFNVPY